MTDTALNDYLMSGTTTQRLAFVPNPGVAASGPTLTPYWWDTTLTQLFAWIGGAWVGPLGGGGASFEATPTVPVLANFTLLNPGTAALSAGVGGVRLDAPAAATNMRLAKLTAGPPATPYTLKARVTPLPAQASANYPRGLFFMNSGSGKLTFFGGFQNEILVQDWTNFTTFNSNVLGPITTSGGAYFPCLGIKNDGVTVSFLNSSDGKDWYTQPITQTLAAFLISVDTIGFGTLVATGAEATGCVCQSFLAS